MVIKNPVNFRAGVWYYDRYKEVLYKVLENNTIYIHDGDLFEGHLLVKHPDAPPEKMDVEVLAQSLDRGAIQKLEDHSTSSVEAMYDNPIPQED